MYYLGLFCQLLFLTFFILSCSSDKKIDIKVLETEPVWFKAPKRFVHFEKNRSTPVHPFFDPIPHRTKEDFSLSYYLLTPVDSEFGYELDLVSGKKFKRHHYCDQNDIWENYTSSIERPPFSIGIVPRLLDQLGEPQKIIVFGDRKYLKLEDNDSSYTQRARVVGGFVLQYCSDYPCKTGDQWLQKLVLVAVNAFDPMFNNVQSFGTLKSKVDWSYAKSFLENGFGRNTSGPKEEPAYRVVGEVDAKKAYSFAFSDGHFFEFKEINTLRKSCFQLYDYMWEHLTFIRKKEESNSKSLEELRVEAQRIRDNLSYAPSNVIKFNSRTKKEREKEETDKVIRKNFANFFSDFYKNHHERFKTCIKFVQPASINDNVDRFWFFSYFSNFFRLEDLGQYYLCGSKSWVENPVLSSGKRRYKLSRDRNCTSRELDESFEQGVTIMTGLANSKNDHYKFVEYDSGIGGSRQKLYSWVYSNGKELSCTDNRKTSEVIGIFPADINWKSFSPDRRKNRLDIIR